MTPDDALKVKVAEYAALRSEITTFLSLQGQFMNYSIALGGGLLGFLGKDAIALKVPPGLLAFLVSPFLIFGILYGDDEIRILRAAHYIETELRCTLRCLEWESYIRSQGWATKRSQRWATKFLSFVNWFRYCVFLLPASAFLVLFLLSRSNIQNRFWCDVFVAIDFILFLVFVGVIATLIYYEKAFPKKPV